MITYKKAITKATELCNMPNPEVKPAAFIIWAEDIADLLAHVYSKDFDTVTIDI